MMNPDGSEIQQITSGPYWYNNGRWSPDAQTIVCNTEENSTTAGISMAVIRADGSGKRLLPWGSQMAWSPEGKRIVFSHSPRAELGDRTRHIYSISMDGSGMVQLTNDVGVQDDTPSWSADGERIAFASNRHTAGEGPGSEIYVMDPSGNNKVRLTFTDSLSNGSPCWSPDGNKIAFSSSGAIAVIDSDGSNLKVGGIQNWRQA